MSYDGQQLQASTVAGLTGWAKALHSMPEEVSQMVTISLNSATDGNHRAEITCAECGLNHCLHNQLFIHTCKTIITQTSLICFRWKDTLLYYVFNILLLHWIKTKLLLCFWWHREYKDGKINVIVLKEFKILAWEVGERFVN